ncbi:Peroxidase superfamily protein [Prunus dulcis]|uniref:Peroxidase n=1 Tax=Prunus dulcis TaxID=3755 RepID=A0A4Y1RB35_PRUDU|nr:Peroxidase superfamily protein [Prunus dulcis]
MKLCISALSVVLVLLFVSAAPQLAAKNVNKPRATVVRAADLLSFDHYLKTCPQAEGIIQQKTGDWIQKDFTLAASIIRLHFHDCAVRGCDASILLNHQGSERRAFASRTLRGFQVIDDIKAELERQCPKIDATIIAGGPFWQVPFGRKDGRISISREADSVPQGHENVTALIEFFEVRGLNMLDLVTLSGAHTIGRSSCSSFKNRLSNFNGTRKPDPSLNSMYLNNFLKKKCQKDLDLIYLDAITPKTFDTQFYSNLHKKLGFAINRSVAQVRCKNWSICCCIGISASLFESQFAVSMVKLGNVQVLTRPNEGEIRVNCNFVNA